MNLLFQVQVDDRSVLGIKIDLFYPPHWHAGDENLAAGLETADVGEPGVDFVGRSSDGHACPSLDREPDDGGDAEKDKSAD